MSQSLLINPTALESGIEAAFLARAGISEASRDAFARFAQTGLPNRRVEGWRWSDFSAGGRAPDAANDGVATADHVLFAEADFVRIEIKGGAIETPAEEINGLALSVEPAASLPQAFDSHPLAALNAAFTDHVLVLRVAPGAKLEKPIHIRHAFAGDEPQATRVHIDIGEGATATIIETYQGYGAFYSALGSANIDAKATLTRYVLNDTHSRSIIHGAFQADLHQEAHLGGVSLSTGAALARHETTLDCVRGAASCDIKSAALVDGVRHSDFTSLVRFAGPDCETRQTHKGVARDKGRNVFQGKFLVERPAQKTDAQMRADALLLSDMADANHKPELEIYADDVECAHGSACGALDEDALFYMRQRGLDLGEARALLIAAFVGDVIDDIEDEAVQVAFRQIIDAWLGQS
ncbi:MAG: Fe-S cluster assembly protein SufD [Pseudomonadota bacterium]